MHMHFFCVPLLLLLLQFRTQPHLTHAQLHDSSHLQAGSRYDLQAIYRLVGLWLPLSSEPEVNDTMGLMFDKGFPSYKVIPVVTQVGGHLRPGKDVLVGRSRLGHRRQVVGFSLRRTSSLAAVFALLNTTHQG
jgi:hypothetical protein